MSCYASMKDLFHTTVVRTPHLHNDPEHIASPFSYSHEIICTVIFSYLHHSVGIYPK